MKYVQQLLIILFISSLGELLNYYITIPIPGSIYGMAILFLLLCLGVIKTSHIKETSRFLVDIMPILFIPSAVGIIAQFNQLKNIWFQIIIITIVTTIITMAVTGIISQAVIKKKKKGSGGKWSS